MYNVFYLQKDSFGLAETLESNHIHIAGLVVGDYCQEWSHWAGTHSLSQWMQEQGVPGICGEYYFSGAERVELTLR